MMCGSDPQIGSNNSNSCDWTQTMMMNMPATNISRSPIPSVSASAAAATSSSSSAAAKAAMTPQEQHAAGPLRCPRCDSANTKFCYYNNYSLTQPRHFCKACKRYWTRGGTLRNVPVGGGCRKNKRVKKQHHQPNTTTTAKASATVTVNSDPLPPPPSPPPPTSSDLSSFFYGLTTSDMNMNLGSTATAAYDALGLGGLIPSNQLMNTNLADLQQQPSSSSSFLHHHNEQYPSSFGSQAASILMSSLKQQPKKAEDQYGQSLLPYDSSSANLGFLKDVKVEGDHSNLNHLMSNNIGTEWQAGGYPLFEANVNGVTDASFLYWNPAMGGAAGWPDAANSSVAPLI